MSNFHADFAKDPHWRQLQRANRAATVAMLAFIWTVSLAALIGFTNW